MSEELGSPQLCVTSEAVLRLVQPSCPHLLSLRSYTMSSTIKAGMAEPTHGGSQPSRSRCESRSIALPAELRNSILRLILVEPLPIRIKKPGALGHASWPCLANACQQLRDETLPIFLGNYTFIRGSEGLRSAYTALTAWLTTLKAVPFNTKRLIKSLTVELTRDMLGVDPNRPAADTDLWSIEDNVWLFDFCGSLLFQMPDAGLMAHQLNWPGVRPEIPDALLNPQLSD